MKNIVKISILSFLALFISCADLDEKPVGVLSPEGYFNTINDVEIMLMGTYGLMASSNYYGRGIPVPLQLMSDMVDNGYEWSDYAEFSPFLVTPNNSYLKRIWDTSYQVIATANTALEGAAVVDEPSEAKRKRFEGEGRFVRGFAYYNLVRLFGNVPLILSTNLGDVALVEQSTVDEIYAQIIEDLTFAFDNLATDPQGDVRSRPSKGTAAAYLASVYMTRGDWQNAYSRAKWVIDNAGTLNYALANDFQDVFRESEQWASQEFIFLMDFTGNQRGNGAGGTLENDNIVGPFNGVDGGEKPIRGWSMMVPHQNVYDAWDKNDYRLKVSLTDSLIMRDGTGIVRPYSEFNWKAPHIAKHNRFPGESRPFAGWRASLDYVVFRYAEVLLIAAEAANEVGNTAEGISYVNQLRARARNAGTIDFFGNGYGTYAPSASPADVNGGTNQDDFRQLIIEERRIELAFEGKRWFDIVRLDLGNQAFGSGGLEPQGSFSSFRYLLPIPQHQMDLSPNFIQNPGY